METFLTVKEAAQLTGKSPSSIRRIIYPIIHDDKHPDRQHVQPSPEDALQLRMKGENFAWRLSEQLFRREVPVESAPEKGTAAAAQRASTQEGGELLSMLRRELDIKNQQIVQQSEIIGKQMELISGLSERLREGNILMGSLQQRLGMPNVKQSPMPDAAEVKSTPKPVEKEKGTKPMPKNTKPKKGFFARLFR